VDFYAWTIKPGPTSERWRRSISSKRAGGLPCGQPAPSVGSFSKRAPAPPSACGLPGLAQQRRLGLPASQGLSLGLEDVEAQVVMYGEIAAVIERVEPEVEPTRIRLAIED
jgi:hypothetical protein